MKVVVFNLMIPIAIDELNKEMGSILLCRVLVRLIIYRLEVASRLVELLVVLRMCNWFNVHFCVCWRVALHHFRSRPLAIQLN